MKAMIVREFGGPEAFALSDMPTPEVKLGQVQVRIAALSVNTVDMIDPPNGSGMTSFAKATRRTGYGLCWYC
jgi:hypothetical protein